MADWDDVDALAQELSRELGTFAWHAAAGRVDALVERAGRTRTPLPVAAAGKLLGALRESRRFADLERLADALEQSGQDDAKIVRLHAQALVDQDKLTAAKGLLAGLLADERTSPGERFEAVGLLGRIHKQQYVNARRALPPGTPVEERERRLLLESARRYAAGWAARTAASPNIWHGINLVAVLARARRDRVDVAELGLGDETAVAREVKGIAEADRDDVWAAATALEANVALGDAAGACQAASRYARGAGVSAFTFASTLRQLVEVWQLTDDDEPGTLLLPALRAQVARRIGGEAALSARTLRATSEALERRDVSDMLERNFQGEARKGIAWWETGLRRCRAVARIETRAGQRLGTGFLVDPADFLGAPSRDPLLLTNWHVISEGGRFAGSLDPRDACARFEASGKTVAVRELVAWSERLDASFVTLERLEPEVAACPLRPPPKPFDAGQRQRVYVIGHPEGGDLSFSLHDSVWIDTDGTYLHYRTPTDPGSSGSPVFDEENWTVIALHHAGSERMPRLHGQKGTYEANEGIAMAEIRAAVRASRTG